MLQPKSTVLVIRSLMLIALCATLFSFSRGIGGESFHVYLNDKLLLSQHVTRDMQVKSLDISSSAANDVLKIHYNHCGQIGKARSITIKDASNNVLKNWQFADGDRFVSCKAQEILTLQKRNVSRLNLYYSSREIPDGKLLATIIVANDSKASLK